jgi:ABC-type antimicrobial peptide transport system permease subunit
MIPLIRASLAYYRGLHTLVAAGVAIAVAVLAGALLVGASVRASLRDLALARLGATEIVVSSTGFFREALAADLAPVGSSGMAAVPILAVTGAITHEESRRTTARVQVFGIDDRFLAFHGLSGRAPTIRDAWISTGLAAELGAATGDSLLLRVARPTDIPLSNLQGRRGDVSERIRLSTARIVDRTALGEFSLVPAQGPALSIFVPLSRLQQDVELRGRANALLVRVAASSGHPEADAATVEQALRRTVRLDDLGLTVRQSADGAARVLESRSGLIGDRLAAQAIDAAGPAGDAMRVLTYLANSIRAGDRRIPYSVVAAMDLAAYARLHEAAPAAAAPQLAPGQPQPALPPMWLNEWAAADLRVAPGDRLEIEYFLWSDQDGLETRSAAFAFAGAVPMQAAGGDRTLTPVYPGITDASDVTSWDPPFPVDMRQVRDEDEAYWDTWRAAPKAFVPLDVGQQLWPSPFGSASSIRARAGAASGGWPPVGALDLSDGGLTVRRARAEALAAAVGTTDFGEYFVYFSFFIVVSGLLLAGLFFALVVEQRARELGVMMAVGFRPRDVRRLLLGEAGLVAVIGSLVGIAGAIGYASVIMHGLRTWWVGAVGTTALDLHVEPWLLVGGAAGALAAALLALALSMRRLTRRSPRTLLMAGLSGESGGRRSRMRGVLAALLGGLSALLLAAAAAGTIDQVSGFFGAGGALLVGGCAAFAWWLRRPARSAGDAVSLIRFGAAYTRWRPTRSVLSAALIAFACFVIVSVGAFRKEEAGQSLDRDSGTGGFVLMSESVAPLMYNPNTVEGRDELSLTGSSELERASITRFRLRPGDEASCLTLYQPRNPRIVAPEASFLNSPRFRFARSLATTDAERANPWLLLNTRFEDGAVAAIADQTSLQYVFHLAVGDDFVFTPEGRDPIRLRIVGTLADSVLQSELIVAEDQFVRLFPQHEGYRIWMIDAPEADAQAITTHLENRLSDFGVDVSDTRARLAAYHQVENTYLSTFQALGALGLLLGTVGLAAVLARNVLERRRELGLLGAVGFTTSHLRTLITAETTLLVASGVTIGTVAALVAVAPALAERATAVPLDSLALLLLAVVSTGLAASLLAVRLATSMRVVEAIKNE